MEIDSTSSTNALTITFEGNEYLFMGNTEDFDSAELEEVFTEMLYQYHADLVGI